MISAVWHVTANPATSEQVSSGSTHSQRALILYRRRRFINHLLTYLLTYIADYLCVDCHATGAQTDIQNNESKTAFDLAKDAETAALLQHAGELAQCCKHISAILIFVRGI